jgi:hypothetical protein
MLSDDAMHDLSQDAWAARYAAALERLGTPKPMHELREAGRSLWVEARHRRPEDMAFFEWRGLFEPSGSTTLQ